MIAKVLHVLGLISIVLVVGMVEGDGMTVLQAFIALPIITMLMLWTMPKTGWYDGFETTKKAPESAVTLNQSH